VLYPLNQLKDYYPDLYASLRQNYATREDIASLHIPPLGNCPWNDVLHFSPVHPRLLRDALAEAGHSLPASWRSWFEVDASLLTSSATVVYRNRLGPLWSGQFNVLKASEAIGSECVPFEPAVLAGCGEVPDAALSYYASQQVGASLMLFLNVPHVFYKGEINLLSRSVRTIEV
jgi:hypothetical protein